MKDLILPKQTQQTQPTPPVVQQTQIKPSLGASIIEGMAFGGGSGVAHAFIGRLFSTSSSSQTKAEDKKNQYNHCLEITQNNYEACEHLKM